jgi:hypothetical protein
VLSIAPLYGLRYSPASCRLPPSDIQDKTPTVQVRHYGRPTVTLELSEFDIELHHIPGKSNGRADALSRRPDYDQGERDNENVTVLPEQLFIQSGTTTYLPESPSTQNEDILRPWVDPHHLRKLNGEWWKGQQKVITGGIEI